MNQETAHSIALLIVRLALGMVFFAHGAQKVFGWFGGFGISGTAGYFQDTLGVPAVLAAIYLSHRADGFFMNYFGQLPAGREGFEYNLVLIGMVLVLFFAGAGRYSLDAVWDSDFLRRAIGL